MNASSTQSRPRPPHGAAAKAAMPICGRARRSAFPHARPLAAALALGLGLAALPATAGDLGGRLAFGFSHASARPDSQSALIGGTERTDTRLDARLTWEHRKGAFSAQLHYDISLLNGPGADIARAANAMMPPAPPGNLFDLQATLLDSAGRHVEHRIDRLWIGWSGPSLVLRAGRQAITWGAGTAFHPMDVIAPFAPTATDTEYKPGTDMLYAQWLQESGADLELIAVPRRAVAGGAVSADASTFGLRWRGELGALGLEAIAVRDRGDLTAGIGLSGALGGASWNLELVPTRLASGSTRMSALANISTSFPLAAGSALVSAEYFHNGFGTDTSSLSLASLPPDLSDRLLRGQLYTLGRDYLAIGASAPLSELTTLRLGSILNLGDGSSIHTLELNLSLADNTSLQIGASLPLGARGTEFGGLPLSGSAAPYFGADRTIYLTLRQYF